MNPDFGQIGTTGIRRLINATGYSLSGLKHAAINEAAFRQELALALVLIPLAFWIGSTALEVMILVIAVLQILIIELVNSAIEAAIDRISEETHPLSGQAKDLGSAAVMISLLIAGIVWITLIYQNYFA